MAPSPSELAALLGIALVAAAIGFIGAGVVGGTPAPAPSSPELQDCVDRVRQTRENRELMRAQMRQAQEAQRQYEQATPSR